MNMAGHLFPRARQLIRFSVCLALCLTAALVRADEQAPPWKRHIHPLAPVPASVPKIHVNYEGEPTPELKAWADEAAKLCGQWWPLICQLLATEEFKAPEQLTLHFRTMKGVAHRTPEGIFISIDWVTRNPDDFGMVIHEMTHAIQDYRRTARSAGWLVEGIADYVRYWRYEPEKPKRKVNTKAAGIRDGYGSTPSFLAWLLWKYDRRILRELDLSLRTGAYNDELFQKLTGKPLDDLWKEFIAELPWSGVAPAA